MAKLERLLAEIGDQQLRLELEREIAALKERKSFGLVYERHVPETVIVGDTDPLKIGDHVRPRAKANVDEDFRVVKVTGKTATLVSLATGDETRVSVSDLLAIKRFGDAAYVGLEPLGSIRRSDERPSHTVINEGEADRAQLLRVILRAVHRVASPLRPRSATAAATASRATTSLAGS